MQNKSGYTRSVIDINIKFEEKKRENQTEKRINATVARHRIKTLTINPSELSLKLEDGFKERARELKEFRSRTQNAVSSPLLAQALVKKTEEILDNIGEKFNEKTITTSSKALKTFQKAAKMVLVLSNISIQWKKFGTDKYNIDRKLHEENLNQNKLSLEMKNMLITAPDYRDMITKRQISKLLNKYHISEIFPQENESQLAKYASYACYEQGRVICEQSKQSCHLYFILSGFISKVQITDLAEGISKQCFGELSKNYHTDINETLNGTTRMYSLICKTQVEVIIFERADVISFFNDAQNDDANKTLLRSITILNSYPFEMLFQNGAVVSHYYARNEVIENNIKDSDYMYAVKTGTCKINHKRINSPKNNTSKQQKIQNSTTSIMEIEELRKGSIYGLESLLQRAMNKIQSLMCDEYINLYKQLDERTSCTLISDGAECLIINKSIFLKFADFFTLAKMISSCIEVNDKPQQSYEDIVKWNCYKDQVLHSIVSEKSSMK